MKQLKEIIFKNYALLVSNISPICSDSEVYIFSCDGQRYLAKLIERNGMNHPEEEEESLEILKGVLPVSTLVKTKNGDLGLCFNNRILHLYLYIDGTIKENNTFLDSEVELAIKNLAIINQKLASLTMPVGIGQDFFTYMTPEKACKSYKKALVYAKALHKQDIIDDLNFRIKFLDKIKDISFDLNKLSCFNSHGDFKASQIVFNNNKINGIIDFTSVAKQPIIWEIVRFYYSADQSAKAGRISLARVNQLVSLYETYLPLNSYDKENLLKFYYYQLAVCDYYSQAFEAEKRFQTAYFKQAKEATAILRNAILE